MIELMKKTILVLIKQNDYQNIIIENKSKSITFQKYNKKFMIELIEKNSKSIKHNNFKRKIK